MIRFLGLMLSLAVMLLAAPAGAAEIKVLSAGAVRAVVEAMIDDYSRQTGQKFDITVGTTGQLRTAIESGKPADLVIVSAPLMQELEKTGKLTPGSRVDLGSLGIGVVIRDDAPAPDVSTPEAFKKALIDARSVTYTGPAEGGTSGIHVQNLLNRFGITDVVEKKALHANGGRDAVEKVARGEAEIGITFTSEFVPVAGTRVVGPLPKEIEYVNGYAGAIPKDAAVAPAKAFLSFLASPSSKECFKSFGLD